MVNVQNRSMYIYIISFILIILSCLSVSAEQSKYISDQELEEFKSLYKRPKEIPYPDYNPYSKEKEILGKMLFFEPRISRSKVMSCATCHNPALTWTDDQTKSTGDFHRELPRKTPTILNMAWEKAFFWDARSPNLEDQSLSPIMSPMEMGSTLEDMIQDLNDIQGYLPYFKAAFPNDPDPITKKNVAYAIATFQRSLVSGITPFDRWIEGEGSLPEEAINGFILFNTKANCAKCHKNWNFTDHKTHDIGIDDKDLGVFDVTKNPKDKHHFKTVGLREIEHRAPYMHHGLIKTLKDVINHYDKDFTKRATLSDKMKPLNLTEAEKDQLITFLKTLSSDNEEEIILPKLPK